VAILQVDEHRIRKIPLGLWVTVGLVDVFLVDAFHCPGSVMFIFRIKNADGSCRHILHTGDFRGSRQLNGDPIWKELQIPRFDAVYLDTTYCDPQYSFPSQSEAISNCCNHITRLIKNDQRAFTPIRRLFLVGSYLIGKEKVALAVAKMLDTKILCTARKRTVFKCLQWPELSERVTAESDEALVHLVSMMDLDPTVYADRPILTFI
jgi:DNA cross-link repair 1A protein